MIFSIETKIYGDRSVFGYFGSGEGVSAGTSTAYEAISLLDDEYKEYEWKYVRWNNGAMTIEFERKVDTSQMIETVTLRPESYFEIALLKEWEKNNGFNL